MPIQPLTHWLRLPDKGRWWSSVTRTASMGLVVACVLQIVGCASEGATAEVPRRKVVGLACGTPLPSDCAPRVRTYSTLPSTNNCSTCDSAPEGGDPSPGAQLGRQLSRQRSKFEQAAQVLERAARGEFGDNAFYRQMAEYTLARVRPRNLDGQQTRPPELRPSWATPDVEGSRLPNVPRIEHSQATQEPARPRMGGP
jgi:hypothetical protein